MNGAAALGGLAALLAIGHSPSPMDPDGPLVAEKFTLASQATQIFSRRSRRRPDRRGRFRRAAPDREDGGVRSSIARFTDEILPAIAPRAAHLIVETWVSRGACGETEKQVTATSPARPSVRRRPRTRSCGCLRRAKELGVAPHVLDVDCHEYQSLIGEAAVRSTTTGCWR